MIDLKIEYQNDTINLSHPELLNELTEEQLRNIILLVILHDTSIENRYDDRIMLALCLLNKKLNKYFATNWFRIVNNMINAGLFVDIMNLQEFIFKEQTFNNWIIKKLKFKNEKLYGPKDRFSYMKFGEFIVADMLFMQFYETKNENILDRFIATLYRHKCKKAEGDDDCREAFNTNTISGRAKTIATLDNVAKQSIVFNYSGVRAWLCEKYKYVFNPPVKTNEVEINNKPGGWMGIRRHLAGDVLNLEKVDQVLMHDVLADLNEKMSEA